jgi:hypothetical protein
MSKHATTPKSTLPIVPTRPTKYQPGQEYRTAEYCGSAEHLAKLADEINRFIATQHAQHQAFIYSLENWMEAHGMAITSTPTPTQPYAT